MHVVFFSRRAWPAIGGVERHLLFLCEVLFELQPDLRISVVTEALSSDSKKQETHNGVTYYRFPILETAGQPEIKKSVAKAMQELLPVIKSADVIHVHDVFFWLLPISPHVFQKKIFTTFHGYEPPGPPNWRQRFWHQFAEVLSDGNICVGGFHQKWYGVQPTFTTFGATTWSKNLREKSEKKRNKKLIFVGRLDHDTGVWAYLEALTHMKDANLTIYGDGPLRSQLEQFSKDNNVGVTFMGQQSVSSETYHGFDLSLAAGYLSILESLAAGVPVVATYISLLKKDYLLQTPFAEWITATTPGKELREALEITHALPAAAQEWAEKQTWKKLAEQYLSLWGGNE